MNKSFFSIVIPTYNRAEFLKIAIDSVLEQSFDEFELIVIDDASTDNTQELLKEFAHGPSVSSGIDLDIADPIGKPPEVYEECLLTIKDAVAKLVKLIWGHDLRSVTLVSHETEFIQHQFFMTKLVLGSIRSSDLCR